MVSELHFLCREELSKFNGRPYMPTVILLHQRSPNYIKVMRGEETFNGRKSETMGRKGKELPRKSFDVHNIVKWPVTCHLEGGPEMLTNRTERSSNSCNGSFNSS